MLTDTLPWLPPLAAAHALGQHEEQWVLLYSGMQATQMGRFSYLALSPKETVSGDSFALLATQLSNDRHALDNAWFGYLGYELLHRNETLAREPNGFIALPDLWFCRFGLVLCFDHATHTLTCHREDGIALPDLTAASPPPASAAPAILSLGSPMPRETYLAHVEQTRRAILAGAFYQANITRKFTGTWQHAPDAFALFCRLCDASPGAYSAFIRMGEKAILSSSPERFVRVGTDGVMESRPIKGTAPRSSDPALDAAARLRLEHSEKDRAENLMIVDLMRNDLAKSCEAASVHVERLFEVSSYATLHHMASTVTGQKRAGVSTLDAVMACFPPGSMTGAPKVRAMQWCLAHEGIRRGVYSGALGWFGGDGSCDLSVVIRTLVVDGNRFEFQVGGGIVADSDPLSEWQETLTKARGICAALGMDVAMLEGM
jgi:anthranilate/para-aminobenzoate synthase component I